MTDETITTIFDKYNPTSLVEFLGPLTDYILEFSEDFMRVCEIVSRGENPHIFNEAMGECLDGYEDWSAHIAVGCRALVWKLKSNAVCLRRCRDKYYHWTSLPDNDKSKKEIIRLIRKASKKTTIQTFWKGLYNTLFRNIYNNTLFHNFYFI